MKRQDIRHGIDPGDNDLACPDCDGTGRVCEDCCAPWHDGTTECWDCEHRDAWKCGTCGGWGVLNADTRCDCCDGREHRTGGEECGCVCHVEDFNAAMRKAAEGRP